MKKKGICLRMRLHWLILLLLTDVFFTFLVWLANPAALKSLALIILLFMVMSAAIGFLIDRGKRRRGLRRWSISWKDRESTRSRSFWR